MEVKYGIFYMRAKTRHSCSIYASFITKIHLSTTLKAWVYL